MIDRLLDLVSRPVPLRVLAARRLVRKFPLGSYRARLLAGCVERPWYGWCLYHAALEAKALSYRAITAVELGVAGGNGLLCLVRHAQEVEKALGVHVVLYGVDTGHGLPLSEDRRDLLYCWPAGSFEMDQAGLRSRIDATAEIVIGDVRETVGNLQWPSDAPLAAVMFDLDLYTSTRDALPLLDRDGALPRLWCYFDDISGYPENCYTEAVGVLAALEQFAAGGGSGARRLGRARCFKGRWHEEWHNQIYCYHRLDHADYNRCLSEAKHQLPLGGV